MSTELYLSKIIIVLYHIIKLLISSRSFIKILPQFSEFGEQTFGNKNDKNERSILMHQFRGYFESVINYFQNYFVE